MTEFELNSYATKYTLIIDDIAFDSSNSRVKELESEEENYKLQEEIEVLKANVYNLKQAIEGQSPF